MDTPDPVLPLRRCETCFGASQFLYQFDGKRRCRECLRELLSQYHSGKKRRHICELINGAEWAQGFFNWEESNNEQ